MRQAVAHDFDGDRIDGRYCHFSTGHIGQKFIFIDSLLPRGKCFSFIGWQGSIPLFEKEGRGEIFPRSLKQIPLFPPLAKGDKNPFVEISPIYFFSSTVMAREAE
jgi:hypothetical protein